MLEKQQINPQETLEIIDAPHFHAGLLLRNNVVYKAAPIIKYMVGWTRPKVVAYVKRKGWSIEDVCNR